MSDEEKVPVLPAGDIEQPQAGASTTAPTKQFTTKDVFGDDEDDSDLSDEEMSDDNAGKSSYGSASRSPHTDKTASTAKPAPARRSLSPRRRDSSDSEGDDEAEDDYRPDYRHPAPKRSHREMADDEDDDEDLNRRAQADIADAPKRKPKGERKKRAKKERSNDDVEMRVNSDGEQVPFARELSPTTIKRRALDAKLDAIGKTGGKRRAMKRREDGDDVMADKYIEDITVLMNKAIGQDIKLNEAKQPAVRKTVLLPKVMQIMQNASLQDALLENSDFFKALTGFIEPLNGALPSLTIQKSILNQLGRFDVIDKDMLKQSGLGKIVNFYTKAKRVQPEINRQANLLIDKWSKPILRAAGIASGSITGRMAATGHVEDEEYGSGGGRPVVTLSAKQVREKEDLLQIAVDAQRHKEDEKKGGRRPNVIGYSYTVAPPSRRIARSAAEQEKEDARQRQLDLQAGFRKKSMLGTR